MLCNVHKVSAQELRLHPRGLLRKISLWANVSSAKLYYEMVPNFFSILRSREVCKILFFTNLVSKRADFRRLSFIIMEHFSSVKQGTEEKL